VSWTTGSGTAHQFAVGPGGAAATPEGGPVHA
jgi:hypothetical protein